MAIFAFATAGAAGAEVTGASEDLRTGWYPDEPSLAPTQITEERFKRVFSVALEGQIYAQPLVANGTLLVVTEDDWAYGLNPVTGEERWGKQFGTAVESGKPGAPIECTDVEPRVGITGTPVIDTETNTAYFVANQYASGSAGPIVWKMHAINLSTGEELPDFPVEIKGKARNLAGVEFEPAQELERPALLMLNGVVYAAFGSHCDEEPYKGFIVGVSSASGSVTTMWAASGHGDSIWQSGGGLISDGPGQILFTTGNAYSTEPGLWDPSPGEPAAEAGAHGKLGEAVIRVEVQPEGELAAKNYFSPFNDVELDQKDHDLGSAAPVALPSPYFGNAKVPHLLVQEGKQGSVYLLNRDNLGGREPESAKRNNVVQELPEAFKGGVWGAAAVWPGEGGYVDIPSSGHLHFVKYGEKSGEPALVSETKSSEEMAFGSGSPIVTSNGAASGSGVLWINWCPEAACKGAEAELRAYNPASPEKAKPFWHGKIGLATKFSRPDASNGHVYVGNAGGDIIGFSGPQLTASSESLGLGSAQVGAQLTGYFTLTNTGTPLTVGKVHTPSAPFRATGLPPEGTQIEPGRVITVSVSFNSPTPGGFNQSIELTTQAGTIKIPISATATAVPPSVGTVTTASLVTGSVIAGLIVIPQPLPSLTHLQIRAKASRLSSHRRKLVVAYMLSAPATVAMTVERRVISHLCKRGVRKCFRWVSTKIKFKVYGHAGANAHTVNLGTLSAGNYRLAARPIARSGALGVTRYVEFKTVH
jgi:hypothetical protein